jgi:hypothetical protein
MTSGAKTTSVDHVRKHIHKQIKDKYGTLTAYAEKEDVTLQYISNVMSGNKPIPEWMLKRFKIKHVVNEHWELH